MRVVILAAMLSLLAIPAWADGAWAPLTPKETAALAKELKPGGQLIIACASPNCTALAKSIETVFTKAGWKVTRVAHGGVGIDGIIGLRANSCGIGAGLLKQAVERATTRKIQITEDGNCSDPHLDLVIGSR